MSRKKNDPSSLGGRIALVRGDVTQDDFAARLGVSRMTLVRYESGKRIPGADFMQQLVNDFGVDANWLLLGETAPPKPELTPREAALLDNYRHSGEDEQRNLERTSALLAKPKGEGKKTG